MMGKLTSVGDPDVDRVHETLIILLRSILSKIDCASKCKEALEQLYTIAKNHFADE